MRRKEDDKISWVPKAYESEKEIANGINVKREGKRERRISYHSSREGHCHRFCFSLYALPGRSKQLQRPAFKNHLFLTPAAED